MAAKTRISGSYLSADERAQDTQVEMHKVSQINAKLAPSGTYHMAIGSWRLRAEIKFVSSVANKHSFAWRQRISQQPSLTSDIRILWVNLLRLEYYSSYWNPGNSRSAHQTFNTHLPLYPAAH
jgi:hypothetical protein